MKSRTIIAAASGALLCGMAAYAAPRMLTRFNVAPPVRVMTPAMSDSVNTDGKKYDTANLLDNRMTLDFKRLKSTLAQAGDTTGRITLARPTDGYEVILMQTHMRAERFAKGSLKVTSPSRFEVLVNGESKAKKTTAEDSVTSASAQTVQLTLEPERDYTLTIKLLADASAACDPEVTAEFVPDAGYEDIAVAADPDMKRRFYVDDCVLGTRVMATLVSPDGKYALVKYRQYFSPNNYGYSAQIVETRTAKVVAANLPYAAEWMPQGDKVYYTVKSADGSDLYTMTVPGMATERLMTGLETENVSFTPDCKSLIYYRLAEGTAESGIMRRVTSPDDRQPGNRNRYYIVKQDVQTGNTVTLTYGSRQNAILDISPDSRRLLYSATKETPDHWPFYAASIIEMDLNTLATDTIAADEGIINGAVYSPDGRSILVYGGPDMLGGVTLNAGNHPIPNDFDVQMAVVDLKTRKATPLTRDFNPSVEGTPVWNKADGNIYFTGEDGFYKRLYRCDPRTAKFTQLDAKVDVIRSISMGENSAQYITYNGSTLQTDGAAWIYDTRNGRSTLIADPLQDTLGDVEWGKTDKWTFTASDGTTIDGEVTLPPGFDPTRKYPLIVYYYGGTSPSDHSINHPYNPNVFASRDYVVYVINPSGTTGYGQEFSARHVNAWGKRTADDIIEGVKLFCQQHPFVDTAKIGCLGASYGGFMTQYLQTQTDIFAAAVSHAGISNVTSYWGEGYWGYSYNAVAAAKSYPWTDPELFTKQGSLFNADKIHTPLLLLHGTEDTNVPIGESIQLYNALKILGRDVELITVEGANHVVTDPDKRREWQNTIMAWFAKYLQDAPQWWDSLYPEAK